MEKPVSFLFTDNFGNWRLILLHALIRFDVQEFLISSDINLKLAFVPILDFLLSEDLACTLVTYLLRLKLLTLEVKEAK